MSERADTSACREAVEAAIDAAGGWLGFDRFLNIALHDAGVGYYGSGRVRFGGGGDFCTAPLLSPLFAQVLARVMRPYLDDGGDVLELGAGDGTLAGQLLEALGDGGGDGREQGGGRYLILETSPALRARQQETLRRFANVEWLTALPRQHEGFILANEVLDCVPFRLLLREDGRWRERGVVRDGGGGLALAARDLPDGDEIAAALPPLADGYATEASPQATALAATLAGCLRRGCLLFSDYGYRREEYYHPQRVTGTLRCFRGQRVDEAPLADVGDKDITAHVDFTAIADAGLRGGARLAGYVTQAQGLVDGGITEVLSACAPGTAEYARLTAGAHKLLAPHEMGEIVKWLGFVKGDVPMPPALGFEGLRL